MNRLLLIALLLCLSAGANAQKVREEMLARPTMTGGNLCPYPGPQSRLTAPPKGKRPFYISHYGRHGSRYLLSRDDYERPVRALMRADSAGFLTPKGKETLQKLQRIATDAEGRYGELTRLGAEEHKGIARRMFGNYPEIFTGPVKVDARSTLVPRCILSMEYAVQQLLALNPELKITVDATHRDMSYMNHQDKRLIEMQKSAELEKAFRTFYDTVIHPQAALEQLISDKEFIRRGMGNRYKIYCDLYAIASNLRNTGLCDSLSFNDLLTFDDFYSCWQKDNGWWYAYFAGYPLNGGMQPFAQCNLLNNIIDTADKAFGEEHPGATLRFGHDAVILTLACLLDINDIGRSIHDLSRLTEENWNCSKIFPMASNIQFIFYRRDIKDKDVLVKILLNENEATLPLKGDPAPYYHWKDFVRYYRDKMKDYTK